MATPRLLFAAALLACAGATTLTGCTPSDDGPTVSAASAAAQADEGADDLLDDDDELFAEEEVPYSAVAAPACAVPTVGPGHQILVVVTATPAELTAQPARFDCAPARYEPTGSPVHYGFTAAGVTATLADDPHDVPLDDLIAHLDDCLAERAPAGPTACHGNTYDVVLDSHGRIMRIAEVPGP
ncbi:hypothetical protein [Kitasatospora brasiliensis]|uniref:hypothetical protein n=1 Tax=Kitasatospora brasiliensis TaxID=3058040 RepID=UPI002931D635|nr:hypothetical protein [Kitasatospora sp. K002]